AAPPGAGKTVKSRDRAETAPAMRAPDGFFCDHLGRRSHFSGGSSVPHEPVGALSARSPVGQTLGRYELFHRLAVGGMAEVFLARQRGFGNFRKLVVVKTIHPALADD